MNFLDQYLEQLTALCKKYRVERLYVFGSVLTPHFDQNIKSDLDVLVAMDSGLEPLERGASILQLWNELEALFNRPVDILTEEAIKNPYFRNEIERTRKLIYDRKSQEIPV